MDGLLDRAVHRPCARVLVRLLLRLPVSPNLVTLVGLGLGLLASWQFWHASPGSALLGLLAYFLSSVADHADGELARLTGRVTVFGRWLDVLADTATQILLVLGMAATASSLGGDRMLLLGATAACGVALSALCVNLLPPRPRPPGCTASLIDGLANRDAFYLALGAFILFLWRDARLLPGLLWVLAAGSQAFWLAYLLQRVRS
ncbi:MAG TPA: CDP-alcohol phosphatidyltransferase family protein [Methylomirabilota bacterium]|nr:CDP-alcohol phosphatidyltransferase family protein [Methylomirabilota bacterium]